MKNHIITLLIIATNMSAFCQDHVDERIYNAYLSTQAQEQVWKEAVASKEEAYKKNPSSKTTLYSLLVAQFGLLNSTMKNKNEQLFDAYYDTMLESVDKAIALDAKWAEPYAIQSAVYGLKMGYSPMQGMFLGSKSSSLVDKAKKLNNASALVWKVYANSAFFTPEMWGGDLDEAILAFEKCVQLYESKPDELKNNWLYLDALAFQGQAYMKKGDKPKALATFQKALKIEPEFGWVKNVLLPQAKALK